METLLARQIIEMTFRAAQSMRRGIKEKKGPEWDLGRYRILTLLSRQPGTNRSLAEGQSVSYAAMSRRIDCLVRRGLVERARDGEDRREVFLTLTSVGKKRQAEMSACLEKQLVDRLSKLPHGSLSSLDRGLSALRTVFP